MLLLPALFGTSMLLLVGCQSMTPSVAIEPHASFCQVAQAITYSSRDTPETRAQIIAHNARGTELCGWGR